jgi:HicB family
LTEAGLHDIVCNIGTAFSHVGPFRGVMAHVSNFALRIPPSLLQDVRTLAAREGTSINQFVVQAVAEKVAGLKVAGAGVQAGPAAPPAGAAPSDEGAVPA